MTVEDFIANKGYSHDEFAKLLNVSVSIVKLWEYKVTSPRLIHALKIRDISKNKVKLEEMLSMKDLRGLEEWR